MRRLEKHPLPAREPTDTHGIYCLNTWCGRLPSVFPLTTSQASFKTQMTRNALRVCRLKSKPSKAGVLLKHGINYLHRAQPCVCGGISTPNAQLRGNTFVGITFLLLPNSTTGVSNTTQFLAASPQFLPASPRVRSERQPGSLAPIQVTHGSPQASGTPQMVQAFFKEALFSSTSISISSRVWFHHTEDNTTPATRPW